MNKKYICCNLVMKSELVGAPIFIAYTLSVYIYYLPERVTGY